MGHNIIKVLAETGQCHSQAVVIGWHSLELEKGLCHLLPVDYIMIMSHDKKYIMQCPYILLIM